MRPVQGFPRCQGGAAVEVEDDTSNFDAVDCDSWDKWIEVCHANSIQVGHASWCYVQGGTEKAGTTSQPQHQRQGGKNVATLWVCAAFPLSGAAVSFLRLWCGAAVLLTLLGGAPFFLALLGGAAFLPRAFWWCCFPPGGGAVLLFLGCGAIFPPSVFRVLLFPLF